MLNVHVQDRPTPPPLQIFNDLLNHCGIGFTPILGINILVYTCMQISIPFPGHACPKQDHIQAALHWTFICMLCFPTTKGSDHRSLDWIGDKGVRCCPSCWFCIALWGSSAGTCGVSVRLDYSGMECICEGQELMTKAVGSPCQINWFLPQGNWLFLMFCLPGLSHPWEPSHEVFGSLFQYFLLKSINK